MPCLFSFCGITKKRKYINGGPESRFNCFMYSPKPTPHMPPELACFPLVLLSKHKPINKKILSEQPTMRLNIALLVTAALALPIQWPQLPLFVSPDRTVLIDASPRTIKESDKLSLLKQGVKFMDITEHPELLEAEHPVAQYSYPGKAHFTAEVNELIKYINQTHLEEDLSFFTSFFTRYYKSENGLKSAQWLYHQLEHIVADSELNITISKFEHSWLQFSTIVHIEGSINPENVVVIGCHQDSTNLLLPTLLPAPGADDNGSGVVTNLEALRVLLSGDFKPANSIEFHFYSAEEGGLLGSLDVFSSYRAHNKTVVGMLQQDMTGFTKKTTDNGLPEHVGVITDFVSVGFTNFIKLMIDTYLSIPWKDTKCGYACSDHASAEKFGYPGSFIIESQFEYSNPLIHSVKDKLTELNFDHIGQFVRLVIGTAYELGNAKSL